MTSDEPGAVILVGLRSELRTVRGPVGDIESIGSRILPFGQHISGTTHESVAMARDDYEALWTHIEKVEAERDTALSKIAEYKEDEKGWKKQATSDEEMIWAIRTERDAALRLAEERAGVVNASWAMIEHYDGCDECQDEGSCADMFDLWEAVKTALAAGGSPDSGGA